MNKHPRTKNLKFHNLIADYSTQVLRRGEQKGFSAVEGLLILVILGILGVVGWFVYDSNKQTNESLNNTGNSQVIPSDKKTETKKEEVDKEAQAWKLVESDKKGFSIRIPDGWEVNKSKTSDYIFAQDIIYTKGKPAVVNSLEGYGGDTIFRFSVNQFSKDDDFVPLDGDEQRTDFDLGNIKGSKYYKKYPVKKPEGIGPYPGMETYKYEFKKGDTVTYVSYNIFNYNQYSKNILTNFSKSDSNQVQLVERVAKTLTIN